MVIPYLALKNELSPSSLVREGSSGVFSLLRSPLPSWEPTFSAVSLFSSTSHRIINAVFLDSLSSYPSVLLPPTTFATISPPSVRKVIAKFPKVFSSDGFYASAPKHGVFLDLPTVPGPPVFAKARRLDPDKLASAKAEFLKMEKAGVVRRSLSPWSSPPYGA